MSVIPNIITPDRVSEAYAAAAPKWAVPCQDDLERIAEHLNIQREVRIEKESLRSRRPDAAGLRRVASAKKVRAAIGTLIEELPDLEAHVRSHMDLPSEGRHADSLARLLHATKQASAWWPSLDGSARLFDPRGEWALVADTTAGAWLAAWWRANPDIPIGKPLNAKQPMTTLTVRLLGLIGYNCTPDAVAKHFSRDEFQAFTIVDLNRAAGLYG